MLTSRHAFERKKYHCGGHSWLGGLITKQLKKWMKAVFLLCCYGYIFHGTGNSAQLCQNFGILGGGGVEHPNPPLGTPLATCSSETSELGYLHSLSTEMVITLATNAKETRKHERLPPVFVCSYMYEWECLSSSAHHAGLIGRGNFPLFCR